MIRKCTDLHNNIMLVDVLGL